MANYYTHFSACLSLPNQEALDYAMNLHKEIMALALDGIDSRVVNGVEYDVGWFECESDGSPNGYGLWLHSGDGSGDVDCCLQFVQHLLGKYWPDEAWSMEWSNDCSKPRLDAYGGGAAVVTKDKIYSMNTGEWIGETLKQLNKAYHNTAV